MTRPGDATGSRAAGTNGPGRAGVGTLVISLDFELLWGVRDKYPPDGGAYRENLLGSRRVIPRMLELFAEFGVAATWATVGFLFATSRRELEDYRPAVLPEYEDPALSPYGDPIGEGEEDDPLHFAPSLIEAIRQTPRQEIGTHTFSHYFCLDRGQTRAAFEADLRSARAIAAARGIEIRSIIFPRNQFNPDYTDVLVAEGVVCHRPKEKSWLYDYHNPVYGGGRVQRGLRKVDTYVNLSGSNLSDWGDVAAGSGLYEIPSSRFLRPYSPRLQGIEPLRIRRIARDMHEAAVAGKIFHLWWHPHNFGKNIDANLDVLRRVLEVYSHCRLTRGMQSLTMAEVADLARVHLQAAPRSDPQGRPATEVAVTGHPFSGDLTE